MPFARNTVVIAILLGFLPSAAEANPERLISFTWTTYKKSGSDADAGRQYKVNHLYCFPNQPCELHEIWIVDRCDKDPSLGLMIDTHTWSDQENLKVTDDGKSLRVTVSYPSGEITTHRLHFDEGAGPAKLLRASGGYMYTFQDRVIQGELAVVLSGSRLLAEMPLNCRRISLPAIPTGAGGPDKPQK